MSERGVETVPYDEKPSWLPILGDFFIHHFFPALKYFSEIEDYSDLYACRQVNKWFRAHLNPPRVRLTPSKFRGFQRMRAVSSVVEKLICRNFNDAINISRLVESPFFASGSPLRALEFENSGFLKPAAITMFCDNLHHLKSLTSIDMSQTHWIYSQAALLAAGVAQTPSVKRLHFPHLYGRYDKDNDLGDLPSSLAKCSQIESLRLTIASAGWDASAKAVLEALSALPRLTELDLGFNSLHIPEAKQFPEAIEHFLQHTSSLKYLYLGNFWESRSLDTLWSGLRKNASLLSLRLDRLGRDPYGLADALQAHPRIQRLDLHTCFVQNQVDFDKLASGLLRSKTLIWLDLSLSLRYDENAMHSVAQALAENKVLRTLLINSLILNDFALAPLARSIAQHPSLTWLELSHAKADLKTMEEFGQMLRTNTTLARLSLHDLGANGTSLAPLFAGLAENKSLTLLDIQRHHLQEEDWSALCEALHKNRSLVKLDMGYGTSPQESYVTALINVAKEGKALSVLKLPLQTVHF